MTVSYLTSEPNQFISFGLSSDTKPTSPPDGCMFFETDTNKIYTSLSGAWTTVISVTSGSAISGSNTGDQTITLTGSVTGSGTGSFATAIASSVNLPGNPTATTQSQGTSNTTLATTSYADTAVANAIAGVNPAVAVQAATTSASNTSGMTYNNGVGGIGATLTGVVNTPLTWDGYTFTAIGQRGLVKNDTQSPSGALNGVYYMTQIQTALLPPILVRALDYDAPSDINNTGAIPVVNGTVNASTSWLLTSTITTVGTDPLTYTRFSINPTTILTTALTSANLFIGNGSNIATDTAMSGDATISNSGVLTLANTAVTPASYTSANITVDSKGRITSAANGSAGSSAFSAITGSTNTTAAMVVGTGASLGVSGSGTIAATTVTNGVYTTDTGTVTGAMIASSATLAGSPTTTTQATSDNSTKVATTAFVNSFAPPAGATQIASTTPGAVANVDFTSIPQTYRMLYVYWSGIKCATNAQQFQITGNFGAGLGSSNAVFWYIKNNSTVAYVGLSQPLMMQGAAQSSSTDTNSGVLVIDSYQIAAAQKVWRGHMAASTAYDYFFFGSSGNISTPVTGALVGLRFNFSSGNFSAGTITLYGMN